MVCCSSDLPRLQLDGELLRLLQQVLGPHRRFDGVEDDADRLGELLEEREVRRGERLQRRQLDDRFGLPFEQHRQHHDVLGARATEARRDARVARRDFREQNSLLLERALTDQPFADLDAARLVVADSVAGEQQQRRRAVTDVAEHLIHRTLLGVHERRKLRQQELAHRDQIALPLKHAGELREVGLEPVLLLVAVGRPPQVVDHRIDVVFQFGNFAAGLDLD